MADYPTSVPVLTDEVGGAADPLNSPSLPAWALHISQEVEAIATELGTSPSAAFATVKARLLILEGVVALTDGATINTDASLGHLFTVTLGGNRTMANPTNPTSGQKIIYRLKQDATGSRTITWGAAFRFGTDVTSPTLTTTASKTDYVGFIYNAADSKWDCVAVSRGY
jgi:hypothetical protein